MLGSNPGLWRPARIEWFIEEQAILRSYDSAPRPPSPPPPSRQQIVSLSQSYFASPVQLTDRGGGGGGWRGAESYDRREKAWAFISHSILSGLDFGIGIGKSDALTSKAVTTEYT